MSPRSDPLSGVWRELARGCRESLRKGALAPRGTWLGYKKVVIPTERERPDLITYLRNYPTAVEGLCVDDYVLLPYLQGESEAGKWVIRTWIYDAIDDLAHQEITVRDRRVLAPRAARQRFLLAEEPWRHGLDVDAYLHERRIRQLAYGDDDSGPIDYQAIRRREEWLGWMGRFEDSTELIGLTSEEFEDDLRSLVLRPDGTLVNYVHPSEGAPPQPPSDTLTSRTWHVAASVVEEHYLPRLMLADISTLLPKLRDSVPQTARSDSDEAWLRRLQIASRQYRWPAVTFFGASLLIQAGPWYRADWWLTIVVALALGILSVLYLWGQLRSIGIPGPSARRRATQELLLGIRWGAGAALAACLILLPAFGSSFADDMSKVCQNAANACQNAGTVQCAGWWSQMRALLGWGPSPWWVGLGRGVSRFAAATMWCTAAGVFLQALWESDTISSPLSVNRWTSHGRTDA